MEKPAFGGLFSWGGEAGGQLFAHFVDRMGFGVGAMGGEVAGYSFE